MIILELCQNHLGEWDILNEMVHKAKDCGASFVKIQSFFAEDLLWEHDKERIKSLEISWENHERFVDLCDSLNITPMTSVYTPRYIPELNKAGFKFIKIGSPYADNLDLMTKYISVGFKLLVSTGGHDLKKLPRIYPLTSVMHCVSKYPHNPSEANLTRMLDIKKLWPAASMGYSSHLDPLHPDTMDTLCLASFLGASFIECHFTILDRDQTKDGKVSLTTGQVKSLVNFDNLSFEEKLELYPEFGAMKNKQSKDEIDLIEKYKTRWKE